MKTKLSPLKVQYRKYLKYVCETGYYEKSVRVQGIVTADQWFCLSKRALLVMKQEDVDVKTYDVFGIGGWKVTTTYDIDGYFRVRTDPGFHHPECGVAGIPDFRRSALVSEFRSFVWLPGVKKHREWESEKWMKEYERKEAECQKRREEEQEYLRTHIQEIREQQIQRDIKKRSGKSKPTKFFQMTAGAQAISSYTNQTKKQKA